MVHTIDIPSTSHAFKLYVPQVISKCDQTYTMIDVHYHYDITEYKEMQAFVIRYKWRIIPGSEHWMTSLDH